MRTLPVHCFLDLIGAPFLADARGPSAYDCVGLVEEVLRRLGCTLPAYLSDTASLHRALAAGGPLAEARRLESAETGCVALFRSPSEAGRHLGIMLDPIHLLHASEDAGTVVTESLAHSPWGRRVLGFYRVLQP